LKGTTTWRLDLRLREAGTVEWRGFSTALERHPVKALTLRLGELERDDLRPTLPAEFPLEATRSWRWSMASWRCAYPAEPRHARDRDWVAGDSADLRTT